MIMSYGGIYNFPPDKCSNIIFHKEEVNGNIDNGNNVSLLTLTFPDKQDGIIKIDMEVQKQGETLTQLSIRFFAKTGFENSNDPFSHEFLGAPQMPAYFAALGGEGSLYGASFKYENPESNDVMQQEKFEGLFLFLAANVGELAVHELKQFSAFRESADKNHVLALTKMPALTTYSEDERRTQTAVSNQFVKPDNTINSATDYCTNATFATRQKHHHRFFHSIHEHIKNLFRHKEHHDSLKQHKRY